MSMLYSLNCYYVALALAIRGDVKIHRATTVTIRDHLKTVATFLNEVYSALKKSQSKNIDRLL